MAANSKQNPNIRRLCRRDLAFVLRNLSTLLDNGLSLAKSLSTLARERSLRKHAALLETLCRRIENGTPFSDALALFPESFPPVLISQIHAGEKAGTLGATLQRAAAQLEKTGQIRSQVVRKLAYPAVLMVAGAAAVTFMLLFVIPVFDKTYTDAGINLPWITRFMVAAARLATSYGWILPVGIVATVAVLRQLRKNPQMACSMDQHVLRTPLLGDWLRNMAVLQFMEVLGNLLEAGFNVADALRISTGAVGNQAMRRQVESLEAAVLRGERVSRELDRLGGTFPPVVSQLVMVGERTGNLAKATAGIREHLAQEIEHQTNVMVGALEPILTLSLAAMIGVVLLAVYLPMFDMIGAMNG